jgi:hypothetical protein
MAHPPERLVFDLPDAFSGYPIYHADFFQRLGIVVTQPEPPLQYIPFTLLQRGKCGLKRILDGSSFRDCGWIFWFEQCT